MALTFAADELNRNPDLLPNISLLYYAGDGCDRKSIYYDQMESYSMYYINYVNCNEMRKTCGWIITGPDWAMSAKYAKYTNLFTPHKVRFCSIVL